MHEKKANVALFKHIEQRISDAELKMRAGKAFSSVERLKRTLTNLQNNFEVNKSLPTRARKNRHMQNIRRDHLEQGDAIDIVTNAALYRQLMAEAVAKRAGQDDESEEEESIRRDDGNLLHNGDFYLPGTAVYYGATIALQVRLCPKTVLSHLLSSALSPLPLTLSLFLSLSLSSAFPLALFSVSRRCLALMVSTAGATWGLLELQERRGEGLCTQDPQTHLSRREELCESHGHKRDEVRRRLVAADPRRHGGARCPVRRLGPPREGQRQGSECAGREWRRGEPRGESGAQVEEETHPTGADSMCEGEGQHDAESQAVRQVRRGREGERDLCLTSCCVCA